MTTDTETPISLDELKDLDMTCYTTYQEALQKVANAWHKLESGKELHDYCIHNLPTIVYREPELFASVCNRVKNLPDIDILTHLEISNAVVELQPEKFDSLTQNVNKSFENYLIGCQEIKSELDRLKANQVSALRSANKELDDLSNRILREEEFSEKLGRDILIESALLFGAFILGAGAGIWGATIALCVMFWFRAFM